MKSLFGKLGVILVGLIVFGFFLGSRGQWGQIFILDNVIDVGGALLKIITL